MFSIVAISTSVAAFLLSMGWLFAGKLLFKRWNVIANEEGLMVGRRLGAAYLGISIIFFLGSDAGESELRTAVCIGTLVAMIILAVLGLIEYKAGRMGPGILVSVVIEILLAAGFVSVLMQ